MPTGYFSKFPIIKYANTTVVDMTARVIVPDSLAKNKSVYYPFTLKDGQRPDNIADFYYNDPYYAWLVYYSNRVIDPYYGWYMSNEQFDNFIKKKYQNIRNAQRRIHHFSSNWYNDTREISTSTFRALPENHRKYWQENLSANQKVMSYVRREEILDVVTNKMVTFECNATSFANTGEVVSVYLDTTKLCEFEVAFSNSSAMIAKNVIGDHRRLMRLNVSANTGSLIVGESCTLKNGSNTVSSITNPTVASITGSTVLFYEGEIPTFTAAIGQTSNAIANVSSYSVSTITNDDGDELTFLSSTENRSTSIGGVDHSVGIPDDELSYWSAVSYYEDEYNKNAMKRNIKLFDNAQAPTFDKALEKALRS